MLDSIAMTVYEDLKRARVGNVIDHALVNSSRREINTQRPYDGYHPHNYRAHVHWQEATLQWQISSLSIWFLQRNITLLINYR